MQRPGRKRRADNRPTPRSEPSYLETEIATLEAIASSSPIVEEEEESAPSSDTEKKGQGGTQ